jgi:V8-like Glu-specific endopeptidase
MGETISLIEKVQKEGQVNRGTNKFIDVEKATVALQNKGGQGVLVNGNLILTAAHCVTFSLEGSMTQGDHYIEEIKTKDGAVLKVAPIAIEPLSDIAALGALDEQEFSDDVETFEAFCEQTKGIPVFKGTLQFKDSLKVYVHTHKGGWLAGKVTNYSHNLPHRLCIKTEGLIEGGTSGGPIINEQGELVGIVSTYYTSERTSEPTSDSGLTPRPLLTLPSWVCRQIESAQGEGVRR